MRTWWPASATPSPFRPSVTASRRSTGSCSTSSPGSRRTTGTCATPSSPSSRASSGCSRPGWASAPGGPPCAWPSTWWANGPSDYQKGGGAAHHRRAPRTGAAPPVRFDRSPGAREGPRRLAGGSRRARLPDADDAEAAAERGERVVLVRSETSPDDVHGMLAAEGILTARGGLVSHAAVVARGWGKPAVVGAEALRIAEHSFAVGDTVVTEGDLISVDGTTGSVVLGQVALTEGDRPPEFETVLGWADDIRAGRLGGAGQCRHRTRRGQRPGLRGRGHRLVPHRAHVPGRRPLAHRAADDPGIVARGGGGGARRAAGRPKEDFESILEAMDGLPVTVRLLDPPLHEFLPDIEELAVKEATTGLSPRGAAPVRRRPLLARVQPDARHPGCAPRGHQARPLRHAGPRPHGGGAASASRPAATRWSRS